MIVQMKQLGFLSAKLIAIKTEDLPETHQVAIRIFIGEGTQTRIKTIQFHGNHSYSYQELGQFLGLREGDPLNLEQLEDGIDRMKKEYRNLGHLKFQISNETNHQVVSYSDKNQFAYLTFELDEGPVIRLGHMEIFGNEKTRPWVIEREIQVKEGEPLYDTKVTETEERLRRLGIFSQVNLEFQDSKTLENTRDMKISVQEAIPGSTSTGLGFRNDLGVRVFGGVAYSNLWGLNHTWSLDLSANRRLGSDYQFTEYTAQMGYTMPWALLGDATFRPGISAERRQYLEFSAETIAFTAALERPIYKPLHFSGALTYTLEQVRQFSATDVSQDQQVRIGSITPLLRLDLRDHPLTPKQGFFAISSFEYASAFLGSQLNPAPVAYGRYQIRADGYINPLPKWVWYNSIRSGWLKNYANAIEANGSVNANVTVPLIKQFTLGGVNSIRGFQEQELNVQEYNSATRVQDYMTYVNYRSQIDFYINNQFSVGPFLDAGNLQVSAFSIGNLRYGTGAGLHYVTPVGPVNFDWGFKLYPRPGEDTNVFYFSFGVI